MWKKDEITLPVSKVDGRTYWEGGREAGRRAGGEEKGKIEHAF